MTIPRKKSCINRTLFYSEISTPSESLPTVPLQANVLSNKEWDDSQAEQKHPNKTGVPPLVDLQYAKASVYNNKSINMFFYCKELFLEWLTKLAPRPSRLTIVLSCAIYLTAMSSQLNKQERDRWFNVLLNAKMPGYTTLSQENSWESFDNLTKKHLKHNLNGLIKPSLKVPSLEMNDNYIKDNGNNLVSSIQHLDLYRDHAKIYVRTPWDKQVRRDLVGFFRKRPSVTNQEVTNNQDLVLPWYRLESCQRGDRIVLPLPVSRSRLNNVDIDLKRAPSKTQVNRKSGLRTRREESLLWREATKQVTQNTKKPFHKFLFSSTKPVTYPDLWFISDSRWVESDVETFNNETERFSLRNLFFTIGKLKPLLSQTTTRRRVVPHLRYAKARSNAGENVKVEFGTSGSGLIPSKFNGVDYVFPFLSNKQQIFIENDSIPAKLESFFSPFNKLSASNLINKNENRVSSGTETRAVAGTTGTRAFAGTSLALREQSEGFACTTLVQVPVVPVKEGTDFSCVTPDLQSEQRLLTSGKEKGDKLINFQDTGRDMFCTYGLFPPSNLEYFLDANLAPSDEAVNSNVELEPEHDFRYEQELFTSGMQNEAVKLVSAKADTEVATRAPSLTDSVTQVQKSGTQGVSTQPLEQVSSNLHGVNLLKSLTERLKQDLLIDSLDKRFLLDMLDGTSDATNVAQFIDDQLSKLPFDSTALESIQGWLPFVSTNSLVSPASLYNPTFASELDNLYQASTIQPIRKSSGHKFPDHTRFDINHLFKRFVLQKLIYTPWVVFPRFCLTNQILLQPLYTKLPPLVSFSFFKGCATTLCDEKSPLTYLNFGSQNSTLLNSNTEKPIVLRSMVGSNKEGKTSKLEQARKQKNQTPRLSLEYKRLSLQELKQVEELFNLLGRDYTDYSKMPKESPSGIRLSPSLEDDKVFELASESKEKKEDERPTTYERLQKIRKREGKFESGKKLRALAYNNQYALTGTRILPVRTESKFPDWVSRRLGAFNMLSDRKHNFFGKKNVATKRLVAQEQKEINSQFLSDALPSVNTDTLGNNNSTRYKKLQRKARKGQIKLYGSPSFSARNLSGSLDITEKPNPALKGKVIRSAYSHLRWQKKRFSSRLLGTPSKRHLVMPKISKDDWKKILEWQLKNYFFLEEKRLQSLVLTDPDKSYKIRQLNLYLPWVTLRTALSKPFEWPSTRLDQIEMHITGTGIGTGTRAFAGTTGTRAFAGTTLVPVVQAKARAVPNFWYAKARPEQSQYQKRYKIDKHVSSYQLPFYTPVSYLNSGRLVSLSTNKIANSTKAEPFGFNLLSKGSKSSTDKSRYAKAGNLSLGLRSVSKPYLCEPYTSQSWLLIIRLFLAFALLHVLKYITRVGIKDFALQMANSDLGSMMTSPEFREWLEHAPPKSFYTPRKRLQDVAAGEESIPSLSDVIWHLRNSGRGRSSARGLLLLGPSGAEKTSLVQAIAGECEVPIIVQSMSALALTSDNPYEQLEKRFAQARQQAPCVLFLDNLDAIGESRANVLTNDVGAEDLLYSLDTYTAEGQLSLANLSDRLRTRLLPASMGGISDQANSLSWEFNPMAKNMVDNPKFESLAGLDLPFAEDQAHIEGENHGASRLGSNPFTTLQTHQESEARRLNLLLRLLTEMDGVLPLNGVLLVGTSERPAQLDPALLRAGRFERRVHLSLPNKEARLTLLKNQTQKIGSIESMPWDYYALRTADWSSADIASAINHSAIRAILDNTIHTIESLEHGINSVIGQTGTLSSVRTGTKAKAVPSSVDLRSAKSGTPPFAGTTIIPKRALHPKSKLDPFQSSRLAFYQAGKAVINNLLIDLPEYGLLSISAYNGFDSTMSQSQSSPARRSTFESFGVPRECLKILVPDQNRKLTFGTNQNQNQKLYKSSLGNLDKVSPGNGSKSSSGNSRNRIYKPSVRKSKHGSFNFASRPSSLSQGGSLPSVRTGARAVPATWTRVVQAKEARIVPDLLNKNSTDKSRYAKARLARTKIELETCLIAFYAGKASELLHLSVQPVSMLHQKDLTTPESLSTYQRFPHFGTDLLDGTFAQHSRSALSRQISFPKSDNYNREITQACFSWQSNLGFTELYTASSLIHLMADRWHLYSQKLYQFKINKLSTSLNHEQLKDETLSPLAQRFSQELEHDLISNNLWGLLAYGNQKESALAKKSQNRQATASLDKQIPQERKITQWWEAKICQSLEMGMRAYGKWYRIYLPKVEEREQNEEWVAPDVILNQSLTLANLEQKGIASASGDAKQDQTLEHRNLNLYKVSTGNLDKGSPGNGSKSGFLPPVRKSKSGDDKGVFVTNLTRTWNDLYLYERDQSYKEAVSNCFYTAYNLLSDNRELMDFYADHLVRFKVLRSHESNQICKVFLRID